MFATPMTFLITCAIVLMVVGGVVILRRTTAQGGGPSRACPQCRAENPAGAHFCSRCGQDLSR